MDVTAARPNGRTRAAELTSPVIQAQLPSSVTDIGPACALGWLHARPLLTRQNGLAALERSTHRSRIQPLQPI